jgi:PAS domain S-box-containing protein
MTWAAGFPPLAFGELQDIAQSFNQMAEQLQAQQHTLQEGTSSLEDANHLFRALLDSTHAAILFVGSDGCVQEINQRFTELFAISADQALGSPLPVFLSRWQRLFHHPVAFAALIEEGLADQRQTFFAEVTQQTPERRDFLLYSTPVRGTSDENLGRFYSLRDITHEKAVDRMKSEFVSLVSHELRTPLISIKGYVDLLLLESDHLTETEVESLTIVQKNTNRLVTLINDLLDLSHLEEGTVTLHQNIFDLLDLAEEVVQSLQPQVRVKDQTLRLQAPAAHLFVLADRPGMGQVFTNLLSNACKYTPAGGVITFRLEPHEGQVRIQVQDTGIGMTAEEQARLFTKFYRGEHKVVQEAGGTGLGLVITRTLVRLHGSGLEVKSAPGEGSTFFFTLPLVQEPTAVFCSSPPTQALSRRRILVVEDDPHHRQLYQRGLGLQGYEVFLASTGAEGLLIAQCQHPDLVCLDALLPDQTGLQFLETLKNDPQTSDIAVLLMSVTDDEGAGYVLGTVEHLRKPFTEEVLIRRVTAILREQENPLALVAEPDLFAMGHTAAALRQVGCRIIEAQQATLVLPLLAHYHPHLVVLDVELLEAEGVDLLCRVLLASTRQQAQVFLLGALPEEVQNQWVEAIATGKLQQLARTSPSEQIIGRIVQALRGQPRTPSEQSTEAPSPSVPTRNGRRTGDEREKDCRCR